MNLAVAGHYALGSRVISIASNGEELVAVVHIPLKDCTFEEQSNVVSIDRGKRKAA